MLGGGFFFCWSNFRTPRGEEVVGLVVKPAHNIVKILVFSQSMAWCQMEQPRCQKYFTVLKLLVMNLWIPATCLLHPQRSSGMQLGIQAVIGLFSGRWYTTFLWVTGCFKFSLSRTTTYTTQTGDRTGETQMPNGFGDSAGSNLTTTKMSSQSRPDSWGILLSSPWLPASQTGFLACLTSH